MYHSFCCYYSLFDLYIRRSFGYFVTLWSTQNSLRKKEDHKRNKKMLLQYHLSMKNNFHTGSPGNLLNICVYNIRTGTFNKKCLYSSMGGHVCMCYSCAWVFVGNKCSLSMSSTWKPNCSVIPSLCLC
jgi:hypothetical protein